MKTRLLWFAGLLSLLACAGCSTPATSSGMQATALGLEQRHPASVAVVVAGGAETNPLWLSQASNADITRAIEDSIRDAGLFSAVLPTDRADCRLDVSLISMSQPLWGLDMNVRCEIVWTLTRRGEHKPLWQQAFQSTATRTFGDAPIGATRLRLATEGAIRDNITLALQALNTLKL